MDQLRAFIASFAETISSIIKNHFLKMIGSIFIALALFVFMFPTKDLSDLIVANTLKYTDTYLMFDQMDLKLLPQPSVNFQKLSVVGPKIPQLEFRSLEINPSLLSLLMMSLDINAEIDGLWGGNHSVDVNLSSLTEPQKGLLSTRLVSQKLNLSTFNQFSQHLDLAGNADILLNALLDLSFTRAPDGDIKAKIQNFTPAKIPLNFNGVTLGQDLPGITIRNLDLDGLLKPTDQEGVGDFIIQSLKIGQTGDPLVGGVKGELKYQLRKVQTQVVPVARSYNVRIDLLASPVLVNSALGLVFGFIQDNCKTINPDGSIRILCRLQGSSMNRPPSQTSIRSLD